MKGQCLNNFAIDCSFSFAALFSCYMLCKSLTCGTFDRSDGLQSGKSKSFPIRRCTGSDQIKTDNIIVQHCGTFS